MLNYDKKHVYLIVGNLFFKGRIHYCLHFLGPFGRVSNKLSKWNQCTFRCGVCDKESNSKKGLLGHIVEKHGLNTAQYAFADYPDLEV